MHAKPGDRLGPYEIVALAGAGGMGEVYKARDSRLDRVARAAARAMDDAAAVRDGQRFPLRAESVHPDSTVRRLDVILAR